MNDRLRNYFNTPELMFAKLLARRVRAAYAVAGASKEGALIEIHRLMPELKPVFQETHGFWSDDLFDRRTDHVSDRQDKRSQAPYSRFVEQVYVDRRPRLWGEITEMVACTDHNASPSQYIYLLGFSVIPGGQMTHHKIGITEELAPNGKGVRYAKITMDFFRGSPPLYADPRGFRFHRWIGQSRGMAQQIERHAHSLLTRAAGAPSAIGLETFALSEDAAIEAYFTARIKGGFEG